MHEDQIHVARVVQLAATELAETDHGETLRTRRLATGRFQTGLRDRGDLRDDVLERSTGQVAGRHAEHGAPAEHTEPVRSAAAIDVDAELGVELRACPRCDIDERPHVLGMAHQVVGRGGREAEEAGGDRQELGTFELFTRGRILADAGERDPCQLGVGRVVERSIEGLGTHLTHGGTVAGQLPDGVGLDLDAPPRVEERAHDDHRARRAHVSEHLAVCASHLFPVGRVDQVRAGADDVLRPRARLAERFQHDLEASLHLAERIRGRLGVSRHHRRRPRDEDAIADDDGPGEPDHRFERRPARDVPPLHPLTVPPGRELTPA